MHEFGFAIDARFRPILLPFGVTDATSYLRIDEATLLVRFGLFRFETPLSNIKGFELSGDYKWFKAIGIRISFADGGVTFGTNTRRGLCVALVEKVGVVPGVRGFHRGMTATVADVDGLAGVLADLGIPERNA